MLSGFEVGSLEPRRAAHMRPHSIVETWDVPRVPVELSVTDSHMSFATPANTNITTNYGSETLDRGRSEQLKTGSSATILNIQREYEK